MIGQHYSFRCGCVDEAVALVRRYHYSHRPPANIRVVGTWHKAGGLFGDYGPAVAACFISFPSTRWNENVFELSRLVRRPDVVAPLTGLISATLRHAKKVGVDLVVSYADSTQGHHGGIYQAASWAYQSMRSPRVDGLIVNGKFVPNRTCSVLWGTRNAEKLAELFPSWTIVPHVDMGKHLYWKALSERGKRMAANLGLRTMPYPKPHQRLREESASKCHMEAVS